MSYSPVTRFDLFDISDQEIMITAQISVNVLRNIWERDISRFKRIAVAPFEILHGKVCRQTDRETDRQTDKHTETQS